VTTHWLFRGFVDRETGEFKFYLHPDSRFKQAWSILLIFFLLYVAFLMPYFIAFQEDVYDGENRLQKNWQQVLDMIADFFFLADIVVTSFSAYYDEK
jgi:hypothetical protein